MLVEDNDIDLFIAERLIRSVNFAEQVETITGMDTALIRLANAKQLPDFIFLGLYSNYKDGFYFLREMELLPEDVRKIKIIVLSTSPFSSDEEKVKTYKQVVGYFPKPLHIDVLRTLCLTDKTQSYE